MTVSEALKEIDDNLLYLYDQVAELKGADRDRGYDCLEKVCGALDSLERLIEHER